MVDPGNWQMLTFNRSLYPNDSNWTYAVNCCGLRAQAEDEPAPYWVELGGLFIVDLWHGSATGLKFFCKAEAKLRGL